MTAPRIALVTGAGRGIGAACALRLADQGWDVAVNYARNAKAAEQVAAQVRERGRRALLLQGDVAVLKASPAKWRSSRQSRWIPSAI